MCPDIFMISFLGYYFGTLFLKIAEFRFASNFFYLHRLLLFFNFIDSMKFASNRSKMWVTVFSSAHRLRSIVFRHTIVYYCDCIPFLSNTLKLLVVKCNRYPIILTLWVITMCIIVIAFYLLWLVNN